MRLPIKAYQDHKTSAAARDIPFLLTFQEWKRIWTASGHFARRGRLKGQYCMARFGDVGPYAVGNVRIITVEANRAEQGLTNETRAKMRAAKLGTTQSEETKAKRSIAMIGKTDTEEVRQKKSYIKLGTKNPAAKLTECDILIIRASPEKHKDLAIQFGICPSLIGLIKRRQRWGHVE